MSSLDELLPTDHRARLIWSAVERLDLSAFYSKFVVRPDGPGRSAIDPKILVGLWLYAACEGVGSARRLARLCDSDVAYRWICGGVSVNYHTLSDFRTADSARLDDLLTQVIAVLLHQQMITVTRLSQDGMKIRAHAGAASFRRKRRLKDCVASAREHVKRLRCQDDESEAAATARQTAARKRAAREREERLEAALAELPKVESTKKTAKARENARVSTTDPEARVMKMGDGGWRPAYNVQLATDTASRLIVGLKVTNEGNDFRQMIPMLDDVKRRTGRKPKEHLVDGGFVAGKAIEEAAADGVTVYAPVPKSRSDRIDEYEPKPSDSAEIAEWRVRMATDEAKEIYKERASTAETVNADLKKWRGLDQVNVRGIDKVLCVVLWGAIAHNLLRSIAIGALI